MTTLRTLKRNLIASAAEAMGYRASGNLIFTAADYAAIERGAFRPAVSENPERHDARIVRAADLLQSLYS